MTQSRRILWFAVFATAVTFLSAQPSAAQLVYATSPDATVVSEIDPLTNTVLTTIPTTFSPGTIAVTPEGQFAYVAANCSAADRVVGNAGSVGVIDLVKNVVLKPPITVGVCPNGITIGTTANGVRAYVSNGGSPLWRTRHLGHLKII